jgi:glycosyltransferase involved in cell wall biosynthesis
MVLLAKGMRESGIRVDLVLIKARGPYLSEVPNDIRVVDLHARRTLFSLPALVRYLRRERPPVLLSMLSATNCIAVWAGRLARVSTRVIVNEQNMPTQKRANTQHRGMRVVPNLMRRSYPRAYGVTAISLGVAQDVARVTRLQREKIRVIYNPVVTSELHERALEPVDHPWLQSGQPPVIIGIGRLVQQKDFPTLLRAFALVRQHIDVRLIVLGEGEERGSLEDHVRKLEIEQDVALPGFVANPYAYMARSALFALSSRWEGLGMVLIEAMACGTPVVSTDCPSGPREILEDGRWGRLVPIGSAETLAEAIIEALEDPGPDPQTRAEDFSLARAVEEYLRLLFPEYQ